MSQPVMPLSEMQARAQALSERAAALGGTIASRVGSRAYRKASVEDQTKTIVAGALLTAIAEPLGKLVQALEPLLPPPDGSNFFADLAAELVEEALADSGTKKEALLLSVYEANARILPLLEQLVTEAEEKLA